MQVGMRSLPIIIFFLIFIFLVEPGKLSIFGNVRVSTEQSL